MIAPGELDVRLTRRNGTLRTAIASSRPPLPPVLLRGKSPDSAAAMLPRLFAICALAQGSAAAAACEAAMASETDPARAARRAWLVAAEAIREHLFRLILGVAETLGETPDPRDLENLRLITGVLRAAAGDLAPADWRTLAARVADAFAARIDAHFHRPEEISAYGAFLAWVEGGSSPFARLCRKMIGNGDDLLGAESAGAAGDDPDPVRIGARLLGPDGADFAERPSLNGQVLETTAFSRRRGEALLRSLVAAFGDGLISRLVARQLDAIRLAESLPALAEAAEAAGDALRPTPGTRMDGEGAAAIDTARGRLIHAVRLRDGAIADYRILAPTDWNFHPVGPVARRLARLGAGGAPQEIDRQARLLIDIFDPCIPYRLSVH